MSNSLKSSIKNRLKAVAKSRDLTFAEIWHNLILERLLARLSQSKYKDNFILKGGSLLARYIPIGRETKDLDFLVLNLKNTEEFISKAFDHICNIPLEDGFEFEKLSVGKLMHPHMNYTGIEVLLLAKLGGPQTHIQIDLGFGDIVEAIDYSMDLISTSKGPLFESKIQVRSYPKEFIFAEKLETAIHRDSGNTRMKDFHDLYSLIALEECLDPTYTDKVVKNVFNHRGTPLHKLPIRFDTNAMDILQPLWHEYLKDLSSTQILYQPPKILQDLIFAVNDWLMRNTQLCISIVDSSNENNLEEQESISHVYMPFEPSKAHKNRLVNLTRNEVNVLSSENHLYVPLIFNKSSKTWRAQYDHNKIYKVVFFYAHGDSGRGFVSHNNLDLNRTQTKLDRAQLGMVFQVPGYFLNDWNNRVDSSGILHYWFQPTEELSAQTQEKVIAAAKKKHPYDTFD